MSVPESKEKQGGSRLPDVELVAVKAGVKPSLRTTIAESRVEELERRLLRDGLVTVRAAALANLPGREAQAVVYAARTIEQAEETRVAEGPILPGGPPRTPDESVFAQHLRLGRALGYPDCCVRAFLDRLRRGVTRRSGGGDANEDFVAAEDAAKASTRFLAPLNNLLFDRQFRLVSFYPCRFDCDAGLAYAVAVRRALEASDAAGARRIVDGLAGAIGIDTTGKRGPEVAGDSVLVLHFEAA